MKTTKILIVVFLLLALMSTLILPLAASEPPAQESAGGFEFHPEGFIDSLQYMGTGMIGIFLVIGIIVIATIVLNKAFSSKPKNNE